MGLLSNTSLASFQANSFSGLKHKKVSGATFVIVYEKGKGRSQDAIAVNDEVQAISLGAAIAKTKAPITGRITSSDGQPIANVSVRVKGVNRGTTTNDAGEFTIEAARGETLVISSVGYQTPRNNRWRKRHGAHFLNGIG